MTTIWFGQAVAFQYRLIDYYQNEGYGLDWYLQVLQNRGYTYGTAYLPWDGGARSLGTGKSIEEMMRAKGFKVKVLKQEKIHNGINAVRTIFPQCWFDHEKCGEGIRSLRRYQWGKDTKSGHRKHEPEHDDASHGADGFRTFAMAIKDPAAGRGPGLPGAQRRLGSSWNSGIAPSERWMG